MKIVSEELCSQFLMIAIFYVVFCIYLLCSCCAGMAVGKQIVYQRVLRLPV